VGLRSRLIDSIDRRNTVVSALFPPWTWAIRWPLLLVAVLCAAAAAALALFLRASPYVPLDDSIDRGIQSISWGPLAATFPFFTWVGGPGGGYMEAATLLLVLLLNRRAWLFALAADAGGYWYFFLVGLIHRPRPTADQVLHITEHQGSSSFPSGHVIFITLSLATLMVCVGHRYLPRWATLTGWAIVAAIVLLAGISRVYGGAHWPLDVLGGILIAGGWIALLTSIRWLSDRAIDKHAP
jgi:membrane-associated phospholipid phosphatase